MRDLILFLAAGTQFSIASVAFAADQHFVRVDDMLIETTGDLHVQGAIKKEAELWEDGVLPVTFHGISAERQTLFLNSCKKWEQAANVRCVLGKYKGRTLKVTAHKGIGCFSIWGMGSAFLVLKRWMNLGPNCWTQGTILHELGHSFGMIHEHQRVDRDEYITIQKENVKKTFLNFNFKTNFALQPAKFQTPYDFTSIMHYWRKAFSKNGGDTIVPKTAYSQFIDVIGMGDDLSDQDKETLRTMYGAPH